MQRTIEVTAFYTQDADSVFQSALHFSEMTDAMAGLATYEGLPDNGTAREGDTLVVDVTFWGWFKQTGHSMYIERLDREARVIQSRESGNGIRRWDHRLSVQRDGALTRWTDTVVLDAGWRTPFVAIFAAYMYRRRHRYRKTESVSVRFFRA